MNDQLKAKDLLPIPNLLEAKSLLVVQAHPDDADVGAGATLARLSDAGARITYLTVTDGSIGTEDPSISREELARIRRREGEAAARTLGAVECLWLDFPDGGNLQRQEVCREIVRAIRRVQPSALLVMDPWLPYEAHSDHTITGQAAAEACLYSYFPHYCPEHLEEGLSLHRVEMVAFYGTSRPNTFVDVTATWPRKMEALKLHASQFPPPVFQLLSFYFSTRARELAQGRGYEMAEAFKVLTPVHLHYFEDAWQC
ncbi:MAG TPA: PIG-L family deacetylase [Bacillota bacterium]|nr:PIG-L family deacetylase [Bacillota bacterium]HPZ65606.1 PIG-L family deacetylase [Bacillota bacterium]HQD06213.1 PIG-L family deacetylase [Bacillota bacterium]